MKNLVKKFLPKKIISIYRLRGNFWSSLKRIISLKEKENYVLLLGTPVHENVGDHLIAMAERKFLEEQCGYKAVEIPIEAYKVFKFLLIKNVKKSVCICVQGGGWLGTLWIEDELLVQDILLHFRNNKIVIFPQTAFYETDADSYKKLVYKGKTAYEQSNVYVCVREINSYKTFKTLFPNSKIFLQPDMALYIEGAGRQERLMDVAICFRNDCEDIKKDLKNQIVNYLTQNSVSYSIVSTINRGNIRETSRIRFINDKLKEFGQYRIIITDRLHGMIFSYLAGARCIVLDNKTHKVKYVYDTWLKKSENIDYIEDIDDFIDSFRKKEWVEDDMSFDFSVLKGLING